MDMKLIKAEVVVLKNQPMSAEERASQDGKLRGKPEQHSIFIRLTAEQDGKQLIGMGEARPSRISEETLSSAGRYARKMARRLVGRSVNPDAEMPTRHAHDVVHDTVSEIFGLGENRISQQRPSPSVCFAAECALLDLMAKQRGVTIAELSGAEQPGVRRNVFNDALKNPEALLQQANKGKPVSGWLRRGKRLDSQQASTLVNSLLFALGDKASELQGIILNAGQRWTPQDWGRFCDEVALTGLAGKQNVKVVVEDPFPPESDAFYEQAFAKADGTPVRVMLAKPVWGVESVRTLSPYMPHVDLKVTPQKAGGYQEVLDAEREAEAHGFQGSVFLGGVNGTTNLNTLAMASLASSMRHCRYFSTSFKKEGKTRLVHPRASLENDILQLPEGPGFGTNLCRSGLRKRLVALHAYNANGSMSAREARRSLLQGVYDDRFLQREEEEHQRFQFDDSELGGSRNVVNR